MSLPPLTMMPTPQIPTSAATVTKKPKAVIDFESILYDLARTPKEHIANALAFNPSGRPGAHQVRERKEQIRQAQILFEKRLDATFDHTPEGQKGYARGLSRARMLEVILKAGRVTSTREFRAAVVASKYSTRDNIRAEITGDQALLNDFGKWYSTHHRPVYQFRRHIFYRGNLKWRGPGVGVLHKGSQSFEAIVDLSALKQSGWTPAASADFNISGIAISDVVGTWYESMMTMKALAGDESIKELLPGNPLTKAEIVRDLDWAISTGNPRAINLIPEGARVFCLTSIKRLASSGDSAEVQALIASSLGIPKSWIRSTPVINTESRRPPAVKLGLTLQPSKERDEQRRFTVSLRGRGYQKWTPIQFINGPDGLQATARGETPFDTLEAAQAAITQATFPPDLDGDLALQINESYQRVAASFIARLPEEATSNQVIYEITLAAYGNFERQKRSSDLP